jgi:hypothetical protein
MFKLIKKSEIIAEERIKQWTKCPPLEPEAEP